MFFDKPWSEVSESALDEQAEKLSNELGGWVFHDKVDFSKKTPHLTIDRSHSPLIEEWIKTNS